MMASHEQVQHNTGLDPMDLIAIDPGDKHVGMARAIVDQDGTLTLTWWVTDPPSAIWLMEVEPYSVAVIESFELYPWLMHKQGYSELKTSQLIGVLTYLANKRGIRIVMQKASIKQRGFRVLRQHGLVVKHKAQHPKDAAAHAAYAIDKEASIWD